MNGQKLRQKLVYAHQILFSTVAKIRLLVWNCSSYIMKQRHFKLNWSDENKSLRSSNCENH